MSEQLLGPKNHDDPEGEQPIEIENPMRHAHIPNWLWSESPFKEIAQERNERLGRAQSNQLPEGWTSNGVSPMD